MLLQYGRRFGLATVSALIVAVAVVTLWDRQAFRALALEQSSEAVEDVRTMHVVEMVPIETLRKRVPSDGPENINAARAWANFKDADKPIVTRVEQWAQFDEEGELLRLRCDFPVTEDGYKVIFWDRHRVMLWFKDKGTISISGGDDFKGLPGLDRFDRKIAFKQLQNSVEAGDASMTPEPSSSGEVSRYKVVRRDSPDKYEIYAVDAASKLPGSVEYYDTSDGKPALVRINRFMDYDKAADGGLWQMTVPYDFRVNDERDKAWGLAKGGLSDSEIAKELVRQFYQALIDKDYARAGSLVEGGLSANELKRAYGDRKYIRIVSIDKPIPTPEDGPNACKLACEVEIESSGAAVTDDATLRVRPERDGLWVIHGGVKE